MKIADSRKSASRLQIISTPPKKAVRSSVQYWANIESITVAVYCPAEDEETIVEATQRHYINAIVNPPSLQILKGNVICHYRSNLLDKASRELMIQALEYGCKVEPLVDHIERTKRVTEIDLLHDAYFLHQKSFSILSNKISFNSKRLIDVVGSFILLPLISPLLLLVAVLIKLESKGPVFFKQARIGRYNKEFRVIKFRSMKIDAEMNGAQWATENDPRVTRVGKIMRATRVDELPQLFNVLKGDMSLIGPRPEREYFIDKLEKSIPYYRFRHAVRPGITGLAQVQYPYGSSIEDARWKHRYDLYYIKNQSFWLDIKIAFRTIFVIFGFQGR